MPQKLFDWFVHEVANKRRQGDAAADKALLAEVFKLLGNSVYAKFIEAVERQTKVVYTTDEDTVDKYLRSVWFEDLEEIGGGYKIECRKNKGTITRPFQIGIVVYQLAKLRLLQFYYDFLSTEENSSCSRWTTTVFTSPYRTIRWKTLYGLNARKSLNGKRKIGCLGTSGATASSGCSS